MRTTSCLLLATSLLCGFVGAAHAAPGIQPALAKTAPKAAHRVKRPGATAPHRETHALDFDDPSLSTDDAPEYVEPLGFTGVALPLAGPRVILPTTDRCHTRGAACGHAPQAEAMLDPTKPADGRTSIFFGVEALTREVSKVHIAEHEYHVEPVMVFGTPGVALAGKF